MGAGELLTSLGRVKTWLGIPSNNTDADDLLKALIKSASAFVLNYLNRESLGLTEYGEVYDGYGQSFMVLRQGPVHDVSDVSINGSVLSPATGNGRNNPYTGGYVWLAPRLQLFGHVFPRSRASVMVVYRAGYAFEETGFVPEEDAFTVTASQKWLSNVEVKLDDGTVLTEVKSDPADGQYSVADGVYTFNSAQAGEAVILKYSYVPGDIEQAVWEMVGERYKYRDRIGVNSKALGGQETVSFSTSSMTLYIRELLNPYKRVVPVA